MMHVWYFWNLNSLIRIKTPAPPAEVGVLTGLPEKSPGLFSGCEDAACIGICSWDKLSLDVIGFDMLTFPSFCVEAASECQRQGKGKVEKGSDVSSCFRGFPRLQGDKGAPRLGDCSLCLAPSSISDSPEASRGSSQLHSLSWLLSGERLRVGSREPGASRHFVMFHLP